MLCDCKVVQWTLVSATCVFQVMLLLVVDQVELDHHLHLLRHLEGFRSGSPLPPRSYPQATIVSGSPPVQKGVRVYSEMKPKPPALVLIWTNMYMEFAYRRNFQQYQKICKNWNCEFTLDKSRVGESQAVLWTVVAFSNDKPPNRKPEQVYVARNGEPPTSVHIWKGLHNLVTYGSDFFNWTWSYQSYSDITDMDATLVYVHDNDYHNTPNYQYLKYPAVRYKKNMLLADTEMKPLNTVDLKQIGNKTKFIGWVVSNCPVASRRLDYAKNLSAYIPVDIYGKCSESGQRVNRAIWKDIAENYKFFLAFPSSFTPGYVTEKLWRTVNMSVVPIVRSGGIIDYKSTMPQNSYIDTYDFASPKALADYLRYLDSNDTAFLEYFEWKKDFLFADMVNNICDFCAKLNHKAKDIS